jgi:IMP dehydrogenase
MFEQAITFDDVYLMPGYNDIESRQDVSLKTSLRNYAIDIPIISSNMDTITGPSMARAMDDEKALGILHRFNTIEQNVADFKEVHPGLCGVSVGVGESAKERAGALSDAGARIICVDVAHGHSKAVGQMIKWIKRELRKGIVVIAGNVATEAGADYLASCGADGIKVGIGPGSACTTRINTGVGVPQITAIMNCRRVDRFLIADGGIRNPGDAAKALAAGADAIMLGGQLAGCDETPGSVVTKPGAGLIRNPDYNGGIDPDHTAWMLDQGTKHKVFRGMASREAQEEFMGSMSEWKTHEGVSTSVPCKGPVGEVIRHFAGGIRSAFTYVGARNLEEFHRKAQFIRVTPAGRGEGEAHINV